MLLPALKIEGLPTKECRQLLEAENHLAKKWGPQSYRQMELDLVITRMSLEVDSTPEAPN